MLEKLFKINENHTTVKTEVVAGITTFMTMAYILAVNPSLLGNEFGSNMDATAVLRPVWLPLSVRLLWRFLPIIRLRWLPEWA